ncbi:hypothetical protein AB1N83_010061 [Pleurotus pulmonarius]
MSDSNERYRVLLEAIEVRFKQPPSDDNNKQSTIPARLVIALRVDDETVTQNVALEPSDDGFHWKLESALPVRVGQTVSLKWKPAESGDVGDWAVVMWEDAHALALARCCPMLELAADCGDATGALRIRVEMLGLRAPRAYGDDGAVADSASDVDGIGVGVSNGAIDAEARAGTILRLSAG